MKKLFCVLLTVFIFSVTAAAAYAEGEPFSCSVTDAQGCVIHSYYAEQEDAYYLFLTSTEDISGITVQFGGTVASASAGTLDAEGHMLTGAFSQSGDSVTLTGGSGETWLLTVLQSDLPSLHVTLDGATLDQVHQDKDAKYSNTGVVLVDPSGEYDAISVSDAQFKGRGNSSWVYYDKKGYQIKFDKKTSVLGMPKAKKWVLLANACDDSMMKNYLAFDLASQLDGILYPKSEFVDLWINGEYRGTYQIAEKVEIGSGRVDLSDPYGAVFELDNAFYSDEEHWFSYPDMGYFTVKDSVNEDADSVNEAIRLFEGKLDGVFDAIRRTNHNMSLEDLAAWIDLESAATYYLINEYLRNDEAITTSFYWYMDGENDVLHNGPVWDFDTSAGDDASTNYIYRGTFFLEMLRCKEFLRYTEQIYQEKTSVFADLTETCERIAAELARSAGMNYIRWNCLGTAHAKGTYHNSYDEAVSALTQWLGIRQGAFQIYSPPLDASVSDDCRSMSIVLEGYDAYDTVLFPTWSAENGQDDIRWYSAEKDENGNWSCAVNLEDHNSAGIYNIHAYGWRDGQRKLVENVTAYVPFAVKPKRLTAAVSGDSRSMTITLTGCEDYETVWFPTWSAEGGQDDIVWYVAEKRENEDWTCTVDMSRHNSAGTYIIHVYGGGSRPEELITSGTAYAPVAIPPALTASVSGDSRSMTITLSGYGQYETVWFPTWSAAGGQDDVVWYAAEKRENGDWACTVDMSRHNSAGTYIIHVYGGGSRPEELITSGTAYAPLAIAPPLTASVSGDSRSMTITLSGYGQYETVWFPTWSAAGGQDDIVWYAAEKQENGDWTCTVDLTAHQSTGLYFIHVYAGNGQPETLVADTTVSV